MRKKGFTLIELVGVIVILGIILLIIMPNISGTLNRTKVNLNKEQETSLLDAAKKWGTSKLTVKGGDVYLNGKIITYVTIKQLQDDGFLEDKTVKDLTNKSEISKNTKICINYKKNQLVYTMSKNNSCGTSETSYILTYNANGGKITGTTTVNFKASNKVDLTKKATKDGYIFVGWNTSKVATKGLSEFVMPENNTTLYAIFKKTINITYNKDAGISSIGQTSHTCTLYNDRSDCDISLPTITTQSGYTSLGWYNGDTKIGNSGGNYTVSSDVSLTAKSEMIDNVPPTIKFSPNNQSSYISGGKSVTITISDSGVGLKANQQVYYAWSNSNTVAPSFNDSFALNNKDSVKSASIIVPSSASSSLNGTQYLWIKAGISDTKGNVLKNNTVSGAFKFDNQTPTLSISTTVTTKSVTVVAKASATSDITKYEYSKDGGSTWVKGDKEHTFDGLKEGENYNIVVRVTSTTGGTTTASTMVTTDKIDSPTFTSSEGIANITVTINYPSGCNGKYTCTYTKDNGEVKKVIGNTEEVNFTKSGTLIATVTDGTNSADSSYTVEIKPLMSKRTTGSFWQDDYRKKIKTISVLTSADVPSNAVKSWDVSEAQDKGVMAWIDSDYNLYIGGNGGVIANSDLSKMFSEFTSVTSINLTNLDTKNTTNMSNLFYGDTSLTSLEISTLNTSEVIDMSGMFSNLASIDGIDITTLDTSKVTDMSSMFKDDNKLTTLLIDKLNTENVVNMSNMFNGCTSLLNLTLSFTTYNVTNMSYMFANCGALTSLDVSSFDTSKVTNMSYMFQNCASLSSIDLSNFNTAEVTNMSYMFNGMLSITKLNLNFDTSNVTNMSNMFFDMQNLTELNIKSFSTHNVTNMEKMFAETPLLASLDISSFNTSSVTTMESMFRGCSSLKTLDLTNFETENVTNMSSMFQECSGLTELKTDNFNTEKVTNMDAMFYGCSSISQIKLCTFNTSKVTSMSAMFGNDINLSEVLVSSLFTTSNANITDMFNGSKTTSTTLSKECENIDIPQVDFSYITTPNSIQVIAFTNNESEVVKYEFSIDGGKTYVNNGVDVEITNVTDGVASGSAKNEINPGYSNLTTFMKVDLYSPGDSMEYDITVSNKGTTDVELESITTNLENSSNDLAVVTFSGYTEGEKLSVGKTKTIHAKIAYNTSYTGSETSSEISINFDYTPRNNIYTFSKLTSDTEYEIAVRETSVTNHSGVKKETVKTSELQTPYFDEEGTTSKTVTIIYPEGCGTDYTCSYQKNSETEVAVTTETVKVTFTDSGSLVAKVSDNKNTVSSSYTIMIPTAVMMAYDSSKAFWQSDYQSKISTIDIETKNNMPSNAIESWDVSEAQNGSVMAYIVDDTENSGMYKLYIGGNGGVIAPTNSSGLFQGFTNVTSINGIANFVTNKVTNMSYMFAYCSSLTSLDVSNFDTSNVTNMEGMFFGCSSLISLDVSNFDTSKVEDMASMFQSCHSLINLNLCGFDTNNVIVMDYMFSNTSKLTSVYVGDNWNTDNAITDNMFSTSRVSSVTTGQCSN